MQQLKLKYMRLTKIFLETFAFELCAGVAARWAVVPTLESRPAVARTSRRQRRPAAIALGTLLFLTVVHKYNMKLLFLAHVERKCGQRRETETC